MKNFIKDNLTLLTSKVNDQIKKIKTKKNKFWRNLTDQRIPKNPDIASSTIHYLINKIQIENQEELNNLLEISDYLNKFLYIKDFRTLINDINKDIQDDYSKTYLSKKDLKEIKIVEYIEKTQIDNDKDISYNIEVELKIKDKPELLRRYGYDILINRFEPLLRKVLINEVLILNYGLKNWIKEIPKGVIQAIDEEKEIDLKTININDFFEELFLWCLKEISIYSNHYKYLECLTKDLSKMIFGELMDDLNEIRKKIAHAKSTFSGVDFINLLYIIKRICQGQIAKGLIVYINNQAYKKAEEIPPAFFSEYICPNNLPIEDYDLDGGFVGRRLEIEKTKKLLCSEQDRIISITGAGGIGKTAVALKTSYNILADNNNPFEAIIWFSAKETKLTAEHGIVPIKSDIECCEQLVKDTLSIIDNKTLEIFEKNLISHDIVKKHLYDIFSSQKCLLIIDNLETIEDEDTIEFIKNIPRPSQVLITSRRGLGEIERRYELPDFGEKDGIKLFRIISKERNRIDLLKLSNNDIKELVKRVKCYPLLLKWSIGKVCLGKDIQSAFTEIYSGKSEIAEFVFNDVFELLTEDSKSCLYSMIIYGNKSISKPFLMHLANLDDYAFDNTIRELIITSFIYPESSSTELGLVTNYSMLSLTRGFIQHKLDQNQKEFITIQTRYFELSRQIQEYEKSQKTYYQSIISLGIKTDNEKIAFNYAKSAKYFEKNEDFVKAKENYENAIQAAPTFPYALCEYAKFEYYQGHIQNSEKLFLKAIDSDPENWHSFFHYGMFLKKQNKIKSSIHYLKKAKELNPNHLPIFNELGRVYTFNGEFAKAQEQFEKATKQEKYPNYRHKYFTLQYQADNYRRWSEAFFHRADHKGGIEKLYQALNIIQEANKIKEGDLRSQRLEKKIYLEIGINLCKKGKFEDSIPNFEKCFKKIKLMNGMVVSYDDEMAEAYYFIANYGLKLKTLNTRDIINYIKKGLTISRKKELIRKLNKLKQVVNTESLIISQDKKLGIIDWVNIPKNFGIIKSENKTYLFFLSHITSDIDDKEFLELEGREVSFYLIDNPEKKGKKLAINIHFES